MNFVDLLEPLNESIVLTPIKIEKQLEEIQSIVLTPIDLNIETDASEGCVLKLCNDLHSCSEEFFAIKNLFSELTDDYQRAIIRLNLGIGDELAILWGKIQGNIAKLLDLVDFISNISKKSNDELILQLNLKLKYWTSLIENKIESTSSNIKSLEIVPQYAIPNLLPVNVAVFWEYNQPILDLAINGISLLPDIRSYVFENVSDTITIKLSYQYNEVWLSRNILFLVTFPTYYGTSPNYLEDDYTISNKFNINAGEGLYIYVITKNESDISVNGIIGGFSLLSCIDIASHNYCMYRSYHPNLGTTTITVHDKQ